MMETNAILENLGMSARRRKAPQEIVYRIREQILSGYLPHGSKLPPEHELTTTLCVSRQTLREALRVLEAQGLLHIRAGSGGGAFVADVNVETASMGLVNFLHNKQLTLEHLTDVRHLVEPHLAAEAARKATDEQIAELEALQAQARRRLGNNEAALLREIEIAFHGKLAAISENPLLTFVAGFIDHLLLGVKQSLDLDENFSLAVINAHDNIVAALKRRAPQDAAAAISADIDMVMRTLRDLAQGQGHLNWKLIAG